MSAREVMDLHRRRWRCSNCGRVDVWTDSDECRAVLDAEREAS